MLHISDCIFVWWTYFDLHNYFGCIQCLFLHGISHQCAILSPSFWGSHKDAIKVWLIEWIWCSVVKTSLFRLLQCLLSWAQRLVNSESYFNHVKQAEGDLYQAMSLRDATTHVQNFGQSNFNGCLVEREDQSELATHDTCTTFLIGNLKYLLLGIAIPNWTTLTTNTW